MPIRKALTRRASLLSVAALASVLDISVVIAAAPKAKKRSPSRAIVGKWKDEDHGAIVRVTEKNGTFTGAIVSTPLKGVKAGTLVFRGLHYEKSKKRWVGEVYAPRRNSVYDATWRIDAGVLKMKVTFGPLWKTVEWTRVG